MLLLPLQIVCSATLSQKSIENGKDFLSGSKRISFTENKGQIKNQNHEERNDILFKGESKGLSYFLREDGISYQLYRVDEWAIDTNLPVNLHLELEKTPNQITIYRSDFIWIDNNLDFEVIHGAVLPGVINYNKEEDIKEVREFESVTYKNVFDGIDVMWYDGGGNLEYDYIIMPHANYNQIKWKIEGSESVEINEEGQLVIKTPLGVIIEQPPIAHQGNKHIDVQWQLNNNIVSFKVGEYNPDITLVIDPIVLTREWATYYGGLSDDKVYSCATDQNSNVYIAGASSSLNSIATTGSHQYSFGGAGSGGYDHDAFLVKFDKNGIRQWATYYGGANGDYGYSCAIDSYSNVYLAGYTNSKNNIGTSSGHQDVNGGAFDAFLVKFNSNGTRLWGTYYGGAGFDFGISCAVDANSNVILCGYTGSNKSISTPNAHQINRGGGPPSQYDAFIVKFNPNGVRRWGSYFGGRGKDYGYSCSVDLRSNIYLAGYTSSSNAISTFSGHQSALLGTYDAYLVKFNSQGVRQWGTYYGDTAVNNAHSCVTDNQNNVYLSGSTEIQSSSISTPGVHQENFGGGGVDAFVVKFNQNGIRQWGTYFGGNGIDFALSSTTDGFSNFYVAGRTSSTSSITTKEGYQTSLAGIYDAFIVKLDKDGNRVWGTYYGGILKEDPYSCISVSSESIYLAGYTESFNGMSSSGSHQSNYGLGMWDGYLVKFNECEQNGDTVTVTSCDYYQSPGGLQIWQSSGTYIDSLTNRLGCDSIVLLHLTILSSSESSIVVEECDYLVSPSGRHTYLLSGTYSDTLINSVGCDSVITIDLSINSNKSFATEKDCDHLVSPSGRHTYYSTGIYLDTLLNNKGCDSIIHIDLTIYSLDTAIIHRNSSLYSALDSAEYQWLDCEKYETPIKHETKQKFTPQDNGNFSIVVKIDECIDTSSCHQFVMACPIYVPSSFTPNSDDKNDVFEIITTCKTHKFKISIFNRWGDVIFYSEDYNFRWDGTYNGESVPGENYVFKTQYSYYDNRGLQSRILVGRILLLR